jgi:DNA-binding transcriptional LysR family regulator
MWENNTFLQHRLAQLYCSGVDLRRLAAVRAVVETGSVAGAAERLGYTASAISQSIAALQREKSVVLFERVGRGVRPTQAALILAEAAARVEAQIAAADEALDDVRTGRAGRVRLSAFATAGTALVPGALAMFRVHVPAVDVRYVMAEAPDALASLREAETDVAVVAVADDDVGDGGYERKHLLDDPYLLVLPAGHPEARRRRVSLAKLSADQWVTTASARCNCEGTVTAACRSAGFLPNFAIEADEFATTVGFVAAGLGVAMVPRLALSAVPSGVAVRAPREVSPTRSVFAVTRRTCSTTARALVDTLVASATALAD